jgi:hypothetical protein
MGFAFALGVTTIVIRRARHAMPIRWLDLAGVAASVLIPSLMVLQPALAGLLQPGMFVIANAGFGREAWAAPRQASGERRTPAGGRG